MTARIVVGFDGSEESRLAARWAANYARTQDGRIDLVAVARPPDVGADVETEAFVERARQHYEQALAAMREELQEADGRIALRVLVGHPAERLVRYAHEHRADLLVVGHRNRSGVTQWLTGSVARQVIDHAPCSVVVVR